MKDLTVDEAAKLLRRHPENVRELLREGRLRGRKVGSDRGGTWALDERDVRAFANAEPDAPTRSREHGRWTPWDAAGVSIDEWRKALAQSVREMADADAAHRDVFTAVPFSLGLWRRTARKAETAHERHLRVFKGDRSAVARLLARAERKTR